MLTRARLCTQPHKTVGELLALRRYDPYPGYDLALDREKIRERDQGFRRLCAGMIRAERARLRAQRAKHCFTLTVRQCAALAKAKCGDREHGYYFSQAVNAIEDALRKFYYEVEDTRGTGGAQWRGVS